MLKSTKAGLFMSLFGMPFAAAGTVLTFLAARTVVNWLDAQNWVETPATMLSLDLQTHSDSDSGSTYQVVGKYAYLWDGQYYQNSRIGLQSMSDNLGSWHHDQYQRLYRLWQQGEPVPCYVNPKAPSESLLARDLRLGLFSMFLGMGALFATIGGAIVVGGIHSLTRGRRGDRLRKEHPDAPWLAHPDWAQGRIPAKTGVGVLVAWIVAFIWNGISLPAVIFALPHAVFVDHNYWALLFLLFPAVGLSLVGVAIRTTARHLKFGRSYLSLTTLPGVIGGRLRGELVVVGRLTGMQTVDLTLECQTSVTTGSGRNRSSKTVVLWQSKQQLEVPMGFGGDRAELKVDFQIPYDCSPTDEPDSGPSVNWKLLAQANLPGADLALEFDVPVFKTEQSDATLVSEKAKANDDERDDASVVDESLPSVLLRTSSTEDAMPDEDAAPAPGRIQIVTDRSGREWFHIPAWPGMGMASIVLLLAVVFGGLSAFFIYQIARGEYLFILFTIFFAPIALLMWFILTTFIGTHRCTADRESLRTERRWLLFRKRREIPCSSIEDIRDFDAASSGSHKFYRIKASNDVGKWTPIVSMIDGKPAAKWLVEELKRRTGHG